MRHYGNALKTVAKKAGISKNATSHVALHGVAMCLREKGISIDTIEETLGHQSVLTTKAYVRGFGVEILDKAFPSVLWQNRKYP
ncbi:MAG: site-specific recombinase XerD [Maribacter sp.]